jgi:hypothetical protein
MAHLEGAPAGVLESGEPAVGEQYRLRGNGSVPAPAQLAAGGEEPDAAAAGGVRLAGAERRVRRARAGRHSSALGAGGRFVVAAIMSPIAPRNAASPIFLA